MSYCDMFFSKRAVYHSPLRRHFPLFGARAGSPAFATDSRLLRLANLTEIQQSAGGPVYMIARSPATSSPLRRFSAERSRGQRRSFAGDAPHVLARPRAAIALTPDTRLLTHDFVWMIGLDPAPCRCLGSNTLGRDTRYINFPSLLAPSRCPGRPARTLPPASAREPPCPPSAHANG